MIDMSASRKLSSDTLLQITFPLNISTIINFINTSKSSLVGSVDPVPNTGRLMRTVGR